MWPNSLYGERRRPACCRAAQEPEGARQARFLRETSQDGAVAPTGNLAPGRVSAKPPKTRCSIWIHQNEPKTLPRSCMTKTRRAPGKLLKVAATRRRGERSLTTRSQPSRPQVVPPGGVHCSIKFTLGGWIDHKNAVARDMELGISSTARRGPPSRPPGSCTSSPPSSWPRQKRNAKDRRDLPLRRLRDHGQ
jgi:hypothetical protein